MSVVPWLDFERRIREFQEDMIKKKQLFDGYDNLLDKSVQCSLLTLPRPLDLIVDDTYKNHSQAQLSDKIRAVEEVVDDICNRGQQFYTRKEFQNILKRMVDSSDDVPSQLKKIHQILVSDDDTSALRIIEELEKQFYEADRLRTADDNQDRSMGLKNKQIEAIKHRMQRLYDIVSDSFKTTPAAPSSIKDSEERLELRALSKQMYNQYLRLQNELKVDVTEFGHIKEMYLSVESLFDSDKVE